jgi:glutathione peroxidase
MEATTMNLHDIEVRTIDGRATRMGEWQGKTLLIVNVASRCGLTPQYAGLQSLHQRFAHQGLVVMGFPCNQFGGQEPGTEAEIAQFCSTRYAVDFPMFARIEVNGPNAHPLYQWLKSPQRAAGGSEDIGWNFAKFLVDGRGQVIRRYEPTATPETIGRDLEGLLGPTEGRS